MTAGLHRRSEIIQPDHWLAEYTTELVDLEPAQANLLEKVCSGPTITVEDLRVAGALEVPAKPKLKAKKSVGPELFDHQEP